jgi:hypothetical protein
MRTSFHQSEAQPPNGPLTAATSPDTPSTCPASQSESPPPSGKRAQNGAAPRRFATGLDRLARSTRDLLNVLDQVAKAAGFRSLGSSLQSAGHRVLGRDHAID